MAWGCAPRGSYNMCVDALACYDVGHAFKAHLLTASMPATRHTPWKYTLPPAALMRCKTNSHTHAYGTALGSMLVAKLEQGNGRAQHPPLLILLQLVIEQLTHRRLIGSIWLVVAAEGERGPIPLDQHRAAITSIRNV